MGTAAVRVAQKEDDEQGIDEQDVLECVVFFLAAITPRLFSRVLGADDPPFGPVMGKRGAGAGAGALASGMTTVAASASATPSRCARAVSERDGASPRVRSAASRAGRST